MKNYNIEGKLKTHLCKVLTAVAVLSGALYAMADPCFSFTTKDCRGSGCCDSTDSQGWTLTVACADGVNRDCSITCYSPNLSIKYSWDCNTGGNDPECTGDLSCVASCNGS